MKNFYIQYLKQNLWFKLFSFIAIGLIIISFCLPPMGVVDPSVIASSGEIFAFAALGTVIKAIDKGNSAKIKHNNVELEINKEKKKTKKSSQ